MGHQYCISSCHSSGAGAGWAVALTHPYPHLRVRHGPSSFLMRRECWPDLTCRHIIDENEQSDLGSMKNSQNNEKAYTNYAVFPSHAIPR